MMRAVEALRQRIPVADSEGLHYTPVQMSDSDSDDDSFEMVPMLGDEHGGGDRQDRDAGQGEQRQRRSRRGRRLASHYTPRYSNLKMLRRKHLDASLTYGRAGPCTKACFLLSVWGVLFLYWVGLALSAGSPYILEKESRDKKMALSQPVFGAAAMYFVCACLSGFCWYKTSCGSRRLPTLGDTNGQ